MEKSLEPRAALHFRSFSSGRLPKELSYIFFLCQNDEKKQSFSYECPPRQKICLRATLPDNFSGSCTTATNTTLYRGYDKIQLLLPFFRIHYSYLVPTSILRLHARYSMSKRCGKNHSKCLSLRVFQLIFKHCETFQACNEYESTERQKVHLVKNL